MLFVLALVALALGVANGANDVPKGVASLVGSGELRARTALRLATTATVAGAIVSAWLAAELLSTFSGRGLVPDGVVSRDEFRIAVGVGAAVVVGAATALGLPISTTHALVGGLVGAGCVVAGVAGIEWGAVLATLAGPLVLGPLAAGLLAMGLRRFALPRGRSRSLRRVHLASGLAVSFARGLNDTPKMAALLVLAGVSAPGSAVAIGVAMAVGALFGSRLVARTMSFRITAMDTREGALANLSTAAMVLVASPLGLPLSTTHVSVASLAGVGLVSGQLVRPTLLRIASAWLLTAPVAGAVAIGVASLLA